MNKIKAAYNKILDVIDIAYTGIMDVIIEKLTLTDRDIAIAEGKVIEFKKRRHKYIGAKR